MAISIDDIVTEALEIQETSARESYLARVCGGDPELRGKVDSLLSALELAENDSFLSDDLFPGKGDQEKPADSPTIARSTIDGSERFDLQTRHAIGGLGEVWVAWDRQLRREVALKRIRHEWSDNSDAVGRFRREAEITGYLEHPGVVPIYSLGDQEDGRPFYAMQFIRGRTLEQVVAESLNIAIGDGAGGGQVDLKTVVHKDDPRWHDPSTLRKLLDHFVDVCQTIDYAHSKQVVHRDLKPSNIMLGTYGQTLVVDWGLAKWLNPAGRSDEFGTVEDEINEQLGITLSLSQYEGSRGNSDSSVEETRQGTAMGTPRYMSPEQAAGMIDQIGPSADVYCLGATLYFILTGSAPHAGQSDLKSTFNRIVEGRYEAPRMVCPAVPRSLQAIVMKAMATERSERYASAGRLAEDVQRFLSDQPVSVFADPPIERVLRWTRNHRALTAALAVGVFLTFIGSISGLLIRQEMDRRESEVARSNTAKQREIEFQEEMRRLEAVAASDAAMLRADAAIAESRYADAAALMSVAIDRMENQDSLKDRRRLAIAKRQRLERLGNFASLYRIGDDLNHLARDTEAAILMQQSLEELGVWESDTWWIDLPDEDLTAIQKDRLRWQVYRLLTAVNAIYLTKMVTAMGSRSDGGSPSMLKLIRSYLSTNIGKREARATVALTKRIRSFRPSQAALWLGSLAEFRLGGGRRVEPAELGPPDNPPDGQSMSVYCLIASVDENYRSLFKGYGETFFESTVDDPALRSMYVALETLRRVSDQAPDDYWIRFTTGQCYFLIAQHAEADGDTTRAIEYYELSRSEYGRCIALREGTAFGFADRSTVALRQAMLMRKQGSNSESQQEKIRQLLQTSLRDANAAKRLEPNAYWVYWHVGATAAELGYVDAARDAFFTALDLGFDVQETLDAPIVRLDDLRGRSYAIEFAYRDAERLQTDSSGGPQDGRKASLIAGLEFSSGNIDAAERWALRAISLAPNSSRGYQIAGWCAFRKQTWKEAIDYFEKALQTSPRDVVSLVGAARVAEQDAVKDMERSDAWFRRAIDAAVSPRHLSAAWLGIAKQQLRRGELDLAESSINKARELDLACDVAQFLDLARQEARRLLLASNASKSKTESDELMAQIKALKGFVDKIALLPMASIQQITQEAVDRDPRQLPLLAGDFELPLESYWTVEPESENAASERTNDQANDRTNDQGNDQELRGTPPLEIIQDESGNASLVIRRVDPARGTSGWQLSQAVPATAERSYRLEAKVMARGAAEGVASLVVMHEANELTRLELVGEPEAWTRRQVEFSVPSADDDFLDLEIRMLVVDPEKATVFVDDIAVRLNDG